MISLGMISFSQDYMITVHVFFVFCDEDIFSEVKIRAWILEWSDILDSPVLFLVSSS